MDFVKCESTISTYFRISLIRAKNKWGKITPNSNILLFNKKRRGNIAPPVEPTDSGIVL